MRAKTLQLIPKGGMSSFAESVTAEMTQRLSAIRRQKSTAPQELLSFSCTKESRIEDAFTQLDGPASGIASDYVFVAKYYTIACRSRRISKSRLCAVRIHTKAFSYITEERYLTMCLSTKF